MIILQTERLLLREFEVADSAFILELLNSPGWLEFIGDRDIRTTEDASNYLLNGPMKSYNENGFGLWMVELNEGHIPVGMCGLIKRLTLEHVDIGFAFLPQFTGKGYAYEAALATIKYSRDSLSMAKLLAITVTNNQRSIRLLEKIGFQFEKMILFDTEELMLFSTSSS